MENLKRKKYNNSKKPCVMEEAQESVNLKIEQ